MAAFEAARFNRSRTSPRQLSTQHLAFSAQPKSSFRIGLMVECRLLSADCFILAAVSIPTVHFRASSGGKNRATTANTPLQAHCLLLPSCDSDADDSEHS